LAGEIERAGAESHREWLRVAIEYKIGWEEELERRTRPNIEAPEPIPHPDDIHIDFRTGAVEVCGPMSKEDKARHDRVLAYRDDLQEEFTCEVAQSRRRGEAKDFYRCRAVDTQHYFDRITRLLGPRYQKPLHGRLLLTQDEREHVAGLERRAEGR
jgi:hypothetical protein